VIARLILAGVLASTFAFAQRGGGGGGEGGGQDGMAPQMMGPQTRIDQMEAMLKLNKEQKKQVKTIMDDAQKEAAPLRDEIAKSEAQLGDAIAEGKSQDDVDKAANAIGPLKAQMAAIEMRAFANIYKALDKDQQPGAGPVFFMMQGVFSGKNWNDTKQ
jgi:Spy/CpxP family protein refolding chaperone